MLRSMDWLFFRAGSGDVFDICPARDGSVSGESTHTDRKPAGDGGEGGGTLMK